MTVRMVPLRPTTNAITRRACLTSFAATGLALATRPVSGSLARHRAGAPELPQPPQGYRAEAQRLTAEMQRVFWNADTRQYRAPVRSAETVDSDPVHNNGYVVWPAIYALHALVAGEQAMPGQYAKAIQEVFAGLEAYYDRKGCAYNAWLTYPGNNDKYYDDNAWAVVALVDAFEATGNAAYRDRAAEIMERFLLGGWDAGGKPGGMRWGTDPTKANTSDKTACSTSGAALAAFRLARTGIRREFYLRWGRAALEWVMTRLQDKDGLIRDGLRPPAWKMIEPKWTYNTGVPIHAFVEHHRLTNDHASLERARRLAGAAIDRNKRLYDGLVQNRDIRCWYDSSFFVPYLADGLLKLYAETKDQALLDEVKRNANFAYQYVRDPEDGLYFRNWRLWRIGAEPQRRWEELTGQSHPLEPDDSERASDPRSAALPITDRPLTKTLLATAGMARLFWLVGQA